MIPDLTKVPDLGPGAYSLPPNASGQQAYKNAAADVLKDGVSRLLTVLSRAEVDADSVFVPFGGRTVRAEAAWPGNTVSVKLISPNGTEFDVHSPRCAHRWGQHISVA